MIPAADYDVVLVWSGFGGSVAALRLTEKGYRVAVLEAGRRFADDEFARTSWDVRRFLWAPGLGCFGIQRIHRLPDVTVLAGAGVGGGSLVYANTLYPPDDAFYDDPQWRDVADWRTELAPHLATATRMLGVVTNPTVTPSDEVIREVAVQMGVADTFRLTPVGVFFGDGPGVRSPDPFFGGAGPERTGCLQCGSCMTGCRYGAKRSTPCGPARGWPAGPPGRSPPARSSWRPARRPRADYSRGVAITSSFRPEPTTHVEPVRYGAGSNLMGLLSTVLTDGGGRWPRVVTWAGEQARHPVRAVRALSVRRWSQRTVIALVMQSLDNSLVVSGRRGLLGRWRLTSRHGHGEPNPTWIPAGNETVRRMADVMGGEPGGSWLDLAR